MSLIAKRAFDLLGATVGLIVLLPFLVVIPIVIRIDSAGPAFFRQQRVGRNEVLFNIIKFRTMTTDTSDNHPGVTASGDNRITSVGEFLRQYKLDELPQLVNVFLGDMSFVGPRPELPKFVAQYPADVRAAVLSVRPGITDHASIEFRNESELLAGADDPESFYVEHVMPKKLELYVRYVKERSMLYDLKLIFRTLASL